METFPIVKRKDERKYGEYRTKKRILEIYDAMLAAHRSSQSYQMKLNPSPRAVFDCLYGIHPSTSPLARLRSGQTVF